MSCLVLMEFGGPISSSFTCYEVVRTESFTSVNRLLVISCMTGVGYRLYDPRVCTTPRGEGQLGPGHAVVYHHFFLTCRFLLGSA